jgi:hypothetical protein
MLSPDKRDYRRSEALLQMDGNATAEELHEESVAWVLSRGGWPDGPLQEAAIFPGDGRNRLSTRQMDYRHAAPVYWSSEAR